MAETKSILCVGMPVRDLLFRIDALPARGQKIRASHLQELSGGNAPNAAVAMARLGARVRLAGPTGDAEDPSARYMLRQWQREGIDTAGIIHVPGTVTALSSIMIDEGGERTIVTRRDPGLWNVTLPPSGELLAGADALLTENRCAPFVTTLCTDARRRGIPVVLDADRMMKIDDAILAASSHVIFSAEALRATAGIDDLTAALRRAGDTVPGFLAVTTGADGTLWRDDDGEIRHLPSFPVTPVDTLGAGDVFHGAFTLAIAEGRSAREALRFGSAAAALKCTRHGGVFGSPQRSEVEALLAS